MKAIEVNGIVAEAIEELRMAQPGRPSMERQKHREKANNLMAKLSNSDLRKVSDELSEMLLIYA